MSTQRPGISTLMEDKALARLPPGLHPDTRLSSGNYDAVHFSKGLNKEPSSEGGYLDDELEDSTFLAANGNKSRLKRSNSTSALKVQPNMENASTSEDGGPIISEFYGPDFGRHYEVNSIKSASDVVFCSEGLRVPKLRCRVLGAYFEKLGSKSFAVYSIAVTDADKNTWFVKRRYRNFERLHRHLKDIPNYTLHLPPKRIFSSSTEDAFVHQRCIQLDKYLQDLLSIANVAEQHEVWDFLSVSSKNYSFGKSSSVMRSLAVNVDDAVDDIVRQFKGVSDGLMRKVVGPSSSPYESSSSISGRNLSWNAGEINKHIPWQNTMESAKSFSDNEEGDKDGTHEEVGSSAQANGWHSDNELNSKGFPPRVVKRGVEFRSLDYEKKSGSEVEPESVSLAGYHAASFPVTSDQLEVPPEWTPPNLSVPVLNLVDKVFQLKRRGWLRRQVFWISKQILQLMMEDAIDDWLLRQIQCLRREDIIAQGIQWVQDVLWPDGMFFLKLNNRSEMDDCQPNQRSLQSTNFSTSTRVSKPGSFEQQLEAARRASDVKKMIFSGAPTTLVSLIGNKQYKRCAKDIYYFLQSTICLKQLAYGILEMILISVFPEMRDLLLDVHEKMCDQPV
uniref:Putative Sorting nexin-16 n=1 Tax=Davidia involucrata TaxID=16924 RepID=A0A5B6ZAY2_DAVIN